MSFTIASAITAQLTATKKPANPLLLQLGNYGGTTETMALAPGSAAICNGSASLASSASVTADQRGFALDPTCASGLVDAGAVQTNQYVVNSLADSSDGSNNCNPAARAQPLSCAMPHFWRLISLTMDMAAT